MYKNTEKNTKKFTEKNTEEFFCIFFCKIFCKFFCIFSCIFIHGRSYCEKSDFALVKSNLTKHSSKLYLFTALCTMVGNYSRSAHYVNDSYTSKINICAIDPC